MPVKLCKWGNSLGVRLPKYVVERSAVRAGDYLYIRLTDAGDIVIRPVSARAGHAAFEVVEQPLTEKEPMTSEEIEEQWYRT